MATEVRGEEAATSKSQDQTESASFEQVFWRAAKNTTPLSYPSQRKTVQSDVTLIHSENLR
jgi:hypothetical protein